MSSLFTTDPAVLVLEDGTRIPLGRNNFEDNNASPAAVGRIAFSRGVDHEIGIAAGSNDFCLGSNGLCFCVF